MSAGSPDIRKFVEENKVDAIFSGHIHQSNYLTGTYKDNIGDTLVFSTGNTGIDGPEHLRKCYGIVYDSETKESSRVAYDCGEYDLYLPRVFK